MTTLTQRFITPNRVGQLLPQGTQWPLRRVAFDRQAEVVDWATDILPSGYYGSADAVALIVKCLHSNLGYSTVGAWTLPGSGSASECEIVVEPNDTEELSAQLAKSPTLSPGEVIAAIRAALSLQIKELAEILGIERQTVYSWINEEAQPSPQNREQLQKVYRLSCEWNRRCKLPAENLVRTIGTDGQSLLDLLRSDPLDEHKVVSRLSGLALERMKQQASLDAQRPPIRDVARRHGIDPGKVSDQQHVIDAFTGRRATLD